MNRWILAGIVLILAFGADAVAQQSRIIDDVAHNTRWILVTNEEHPAGPGRWVATGPIPPKTEEEKAVANLRSAPKPALLIRSGDAVTVFHQTETSRVELQARALGGAPQGGRLRVRLTTGAIVDAVATAPGQVDLVPHFFSRKEP